ncbi:MAG: hypothetical protein V4731_18225 [Pseudomonadota bacterium]
MSTTAHPFTLRGIALALAMLMASTAGLAAKPDWVEDGKPGKGAKHEKQDKHDKQEHGGKGNKADKGDRAEVPVGGYFGDHQRTVIHNYYGTQYSAGRCPPGLAKKNNGCMPPGQAKKYVVGQRLPSNVVYYSVPTAVVTQLGGAPAGYRYVRVAADILLIAVGTSMVIDALTDLNRM